MNTLKQLLTLLILLVLFQSCQEITYVNSPQPFQIQSVVVFAAGFDRPAGIVFDADGNLLVANFRNPGIISRVSPDGVVDTFAFGAERAVAQLAIDGAGFVYGTYQDGTVKRVPSEGGSLSSFISDQSNPAGIVFDNVGNLYVANYADNSIKVYSPMGELLRSITDGINGPVGLAIDHEGNLYVANAGTDAILKIVPGGAVNVFIRLTKPHSMAFDRNGNLFVSLSDGYTGYGVFIVTPDKKISQLLAVFSHAIGLAFDASGDLYVANFDARVISKVSFR